MSSSGCRCRSVQSGHHFISTPPPPPPPELQLESFCLHAQKSGLSLLLSERTLSLFSPGLPESPLQSCGGCVCVCGGGRGGMQPKTPPPPPRCHAKAGNIQLAPETHNLNSNVPPASQLLLPPPSLLPPSLHLLPPSASSSSFSSAALSGSAASFVLFVVLHLFLSLQTLTTTYAAV